MHVIKSIQYRMKGWIRMKKIFAILLASVMTLSLAACSVGSEESSQTPESSIVSSSAAESSESTSEASKEKEESSKAESSEKTDSEATKEIEKALDEMKEKSGPKVQNLIDVLKSDELTMTLTMTRKMKETESEASKKTASDAPTALRIVKSGEKSLRFTVAVGLMSLDVLTNEEGTYYLNSTSKKAAKIGTDSSSMDSKTLMSSMTAMMGGTGSSIDIDQAMDDIKDQGSQSKMNYLGSSEESYEGQTLTVEKYEVNSKDTEGKDVKVEYKVWFDGDDVKYLTASAEEGEMTVTFNELSNTADASLLVVPDDYTITETSTVSVA